MYVEPPEALYKAATAFFGAGAVAFIVALALAGIAGLLLVILTLAPDTIGRCAGALRRRRFLSFLCGLGLAIILILIAKLAGKTPIVIVPSIALVSLLT